MDPLRWETVRSRFDELVELPESERAIRLQELRASDPEVAGAVASLLAADESAGLDLAPLDSALLAEAADASGTAKAAEPTPDPLELTGRTISHYRILGPLGSGGMGFVYRAEDLHLHRQVALKFLLPQLSLDDAARERFLREARSAGSLDHPNLCTIHEVEELDSGRLFLAMPLYAGETLRERIARDGPLPIDETIDITRQIARGLLCAHEAGIIHRDLKPGNIMLLPDGMVKILDFGLAKARDASHTMAGGAVGTLAYMAPEQLRGEAVDNRADLWALGVVLYQMLTGQQPFRAATDHLTVQAVLQDRPALVSRLRPEIPAELEGLVLRLLGKKPAKRPGGADEVLTELDEIAAGRGERTSSSSRWKREALQLLPSRTLRRPLRLAAALVIGLLLIFGGWRLARNLLPPDTSTPSIAVLPLENPGGSIDRSLASGLQLELITSLGAASGLQVISSQSVREYAGSDAPASEIGAALGADYILSGTTQRMGHQIRIALQLTDARSNRNLWSDRYATADTADLFELQTSVAQAVADALRVRLSTDARSRLARLPTSSTRAYNLYLRGQEYEARGTSRDQRIAASLYAEAIGLDPQFALAHARKSIVDGRIFRTGESADRWNPAQADRARRGLEEAMRLAPDLPETQLALGYFLYHVHADYARALDAFETALREQPNDAKAHEAMADAYRRLGRWDRAVASLQRAMELDPRNPERPRNLADMYRQLRNFPEAIRQYDRAIELAPDLLTHRQARARTMVAWLGEPDSLVALIRSAPPEWYVSSAASSTRLDAALLQRSPADALAAVEALTDDLVEGRLAAGSTDLLQLRAQGYAFGGDTARARADYQMIREALEGALLDRPEDPHTHADLAIAYAGLGMRDEAIAAAREGMQLLPMSRDAWEGDTYVAHAAEVFAVLGEVEPAIDLLEQLLAAPTLISPNVLRLEPRWDLLRDSPRFQALLMQP